MRGDQIVPKIEQTRSSATIGSTSSTFRKLAECMHESTASKKNTYRRKKLRC
jgi:hypothetical protein